MLIRRITALLLTFLIAGHSYAQTVMSEVYVPSVKTANFNTTADQSIPIPWPRYILRRIVVENCSASLTLAAGGFYTGANKTGTILVSALQLYVALSASTKYLDLTLASAANTDIQTASVIFLSLTTAQGSAATCDVRVFADPLY